jgi:membrane protease YdiL (CAAX protease family)
MEVEQDAPRWGLGDAAAGFAVGIVALAVAGALWVSLTGTTKVTPGFFAATEAGLWVGTIGAPVLASRRKGTGDLGRDFGLQVRSADAGVGIPVGVLCQLLLVPLISLPIIWLSGHHDLSKPAKDVIGIAHGFGSIAILTLVLVIGAPIAEELFFRGLLLRSVQRRFAASAHADAWAVGISAVVFGLVHFEPLQFAALVAFGVVLGILAVRSGRLGPGIWAHAAFNAVTVIILAR